MSEKLKISKGDKVVDLTPDEQFALGIMLGYFSTNNEVSEIFALGVQGSAISIITKIRSLK